MKMIEWADLEKPYGLEAPGACIDLWQTTSRVTGHGGRAPSNVHFTNAYTMHVSHDTDATTTFNVREQILSCEDVGEHQVTHITEARHCTCAIGEVRS